MAASVLERWIELDPKPPERHLPSTPFLHGETESWGTWVSRVIWLCGLMVKLDRIHRCPVTCALHHVPSSCSCGRRFPEGRKFPKQRGQVSVSQGHLGHNIRKLDWAKSEFLFSDF